MFVKTSGFKPDVLFKNQFAKPGVFKSLGFKLYILIKTPGFKPGVLIKNQFAQPGVFKIPSFKPYILCDFLFFYIFFFKNRLIVENSYWTLYLSEFDETGIVGFLATRPMHSYQLQTLIHLVVAAINY